MQILVTGGRGFIGTNLVTELASRGHEVRTLDFKDGPEPTHIRGDVASYGQVSRALETENFDLVYHLAAEYGRWNGEDHYENLWATNVVGTKHILRLQERHGFKMVFFSSAEVYGDYDGLMSESVTDEVPIRQMNDYAASKWVGELQCLNSADMHGTQTVRVRPVNCYGPHEYYSRYRGVIPIFVYKCLMGEPFTVYSGHYRMFDYVGDTVRTIANIADTFIPGEVYNIGGQEDWAIDIGQLAEMVIEATGSDPDLADIRQSEPFTTRVKSMDFTKAREHLDHDPEVPLKEGLSRYVEWMKSVYLEK